MRIGDRYKAAEKATDIILEENQPVIIRLDGKAFHTYTKFFDKPFDGALHQSMCYAARVLCKEIQGTRFAYTQSDEISILLHKRSEESGLWYGNRVQKMVSVAASICTTAFNYQVRMLHSQVSPRTAHFDARAFNIEDDVGGYFIWRQEDAVRNSISMLAQAHFSSKELHRKNRHDMHRMLASKGILWSDLEDWKKHGTIITKQWREQVGPNGEIAHRSFWGKEEICPNFRENEEFINSMLEQEVSGI